MGQVASELVITSNTSGAADYVRAMEGAEEAANRGLSAASGFNLGIAALGAGAIGAIAGVKSLLDYVVEANKGLADLQTQATQTGVSLAQYQSLKFAANVTGLSDDSFAAGMQKSASLLADATHNANALSKEFDANGLSIKNANGQLISQNQLLNVAANLVHNAASPQDAIAIAQMLGFTKEWVPLLSQGATAMNALAAEAKAAGAVISDETIEKATKFDAEWRKSSVAFSANMKAALSDLLPMVDDLIDKASQFMKGLAASNGAVSGSGQNKFAEWADTLLITARIDDGTASVKDLERAIEILNNHHAIVPQDLLDQLAQLRIEANATAASIDAVNKATQAANFPGGVPLPGARPAAANAKGDGSSIVAGRDTGAGADAVERAINSLQKHTQTQLADAQAVGLGDAALAGFRAEAAETAAVLANGGKETDAQVDKFSDLKDAAIAAADALAKAKVAASIDFGAKTSLLSAGDVAIAQQLKGIYGNDVTAALNSAEAAQLRFNATAKELSSAIESNLVSGLTDIASGTKSVGQGFSDMGLAVVKAIEQMIIKIAIVQPLMAAMQASASSLGILPGVNPIGAGGVVPGAVGPSSVGGAPLVGLHDGGIVGSEATFSRYVHPAYFDNAPRMHGGGIAGDEVPIIARKGEGVFTEGQMAALGGRSAPQVNVTLIETPNGGGGTTQRQNSNGGIDIEVAIAQITAKSAATPGAPLNRVLTDQLGSQQRLAKR